MRYRDKITLILREIYCRRFVQNQERHDKTDKGIIKINVEMAARFWCEMLLVKF